MIMKIKKFKIKKIRKVKEKTLDWLVNQINKMKIKKSHNKIKILLIKCKVLLIHLKEIIQLKSRIEQKEKYILKQ
jgi:hypothetical protein